MTVQGNITTARDRTEWFFFDGGPGAPRYGDDPTKHAVNHDTETFVREVIQNANDQRLDPTSPVRVSFEIRTLAGDDKERFLETLQWGTGLGEHVRAVVDTDRGRGYAESLERLEDPEAELRVVTVRDRNTTGLTGSWNEDSNFAALVRDELYSSKQDDTAGGSYGLGKSVLWTFSGLSTVVFNSRLSDGSADLGATDRQRLIGRTKLPTHRLNGDEYAYQGAGWLCHPADVGDSVRPSPVTGDAATEMAEDLCLSRSRIPGTSIMIVDFADPTRDDRLTVDQLADEFVTAAGKYFWPAIHAGDLEVEVTTDRGSREVTADDVAPIRPFVRCFEARDTDAESIPTPGDVAALDVPVSLPPLADGDETPDGNVRLAVRAASPADDDTLRNKVALFRGPGMVVKYHDQSRVAFGGENFHAILICGEANDVGGVTDADAEIDRFLRNAEPPEHDDWLSTENLRDRYQRGYRTALDEMFDTLRDGLRYVLANTDDRSGTLGDRVRKRFPIHGGRAKTPTGPSQSAVFDIESRSWFSPSEGRWKLKASIVPAVDEFDRWTADVSLTGVTEDGARYDDVPIAELEPTESTDIEVRTDVTDGQAKIIAGADVDGLELVGCSAKLEDVTRQRGGVGETELEIRAAIETGEE